MVTGNKAKRQASQLGDASFSNCGTTRYIPVDIFKGNLVVFVTTETIFLCVCWPSQAMFVVP